MAHQLICICLIGCCIALAYSAPSRVKYDQRQEGDLNVRADLENFVILVIPTTAGASPSTLGLLELLSKALPTRGHSKRQKNNRKPSNAAPSLLDDSVNGEIDVQDETQSFIESKTAPYHVDITKSRKNLAKLHPKESVEFDDAQTQEELLVSPNLSLIKADSADNEDIDDIEEDHGIGRQGRALRGEGQVLRLGKGFVLSMPLEVEEGLFKIDNRRIEKSKERKEVKEIKEIKESHKKIDTLKVKPEKSLEPKLKLLLLGAEHDEECGPGYERDHNGVCVFLAHV